MQKRRQILKTMLKEESGVTLLMVLFALVLLSVLAVAMLGASSNNLVQSEGERKSESAFYVAEGGAAKVVAEAEALAARLFMSEIDKTTFYDRFDHALASLETEVTSFGENKGDPQIARVEITKLTSGNEGEYRFKSTGSVGTRERIVATDFSGKLVKGFLWPVDLALHSQSTIYMQGKAQISGNIGTISTNPNSIEISGQKATVSGNIYVPAGEEEEALNIQHNEAAYQERVSALPNLLSYKLPVFPAFPTYATYADIVAANSQTVSIGSDRSFKKITVSGSSTVLTLDLNNQDREIVVEEFSVASGAKVQISGTGKLTVYIKNKMDFSNAFLNTDSTADRLNIYYEGVPAELIKLDAQTVINGSLFAKQANLLMEGGGGFWGHVITGGTSVEIKGGHRIGVSLIYAPLANVTLSGGGKVEGAIVSNAYSSDGESVLIQKPIEGESLSFLNKLQGQNFKLEMTKSPFRES